MKKYFLFFVLTLSVIIYAKEEYTDSRDGKKYTYIKIDKQTWMAENLKYDIKNKSRCYDNKSANCNKYGNLYEWNTAMDMKRTTYPAKNRIQGVCPVDWHIPSDAEWTTLTNYVGSDAGKKLKATNSWNNRADGITGNGTNNYGFTALPGGYSGPGFYDAGTGGYWWSSNGNANHQAYYRKMWHNASNVVKDSMQTSMAYYSVRCIMDKCDFNDYDKVKQFSYENFIIDRCGGKEYNPLMQYCSERSVVVNKEEFIDSRDGRKYKSVKIGAQTWMAEDLRYEAKQSKCHETDKCKKYGRLYNWETVMNGAKSSTTGTTKVQGICPVGWHLPRDTEWEALIKSVGTNAGAKLKAPMYWLNKEKPSCNGTDNHGFSALPAGFIELYNKDTSYDINKIGYWWSVGTLNNNYDFPYRWIMRSEASEIEKNEWHATSTKAYFSVRCVKN